MLTPLGSDKSVYWKRLVAVYKVLVGIFLVLVAVTAVLIRTLPTFRSLKILIIITISVGIITAFASLTKSFKEKPKLLYPLLFFLAMIFTWSILGSKPPDTNSLRAVYISRLKAHLNLPYIAGGETDRGVDSIGLVKSSFWQAMFIEGLKEFNPQLLGWQTVKFWLNDLTTEQIYKDDYTSFVDRPDHLVDYNPFILDPGDIAVTYDKKHIMVYINNGEWIEADPSCGRVVIVRPANNQCPGHFKEPVMIFRWWLLDTRQSTQKTAHE